MNIAAQIQFQHRIQAYERCNLPVVYLDESGFELSAPRTHGYQQKGKRCYDQHDWHCRRRINAIGASIDHEFITVSLFENAVNTDVFYAWITQDLLPKLPENCVIVMDNASFHKRGDIEEAIENHGCFIEWLPTYSPEFNPIEKKWAQAKSIRRKYRCDIDTLFRDNFNYANLL